ncbi:MAG TPA: sigma-70 family RNA polymerase sigma factor [Ktedonobacterales bacterium]|jgi:RNA polymerase sigma-70 factor (ECF subfamily)
MTWPPALPFSLALERARALDQSALGMLYRRFMPVVYRYVLARIGSVHTAEDVTSETFMAVINGIGTMRARDELTFAAWVLGIARNKVATHYRRQRTHPESPQSLPESEQPWAVAEEGDPLAIITARESWAEVVAGLNQLTEDQRAVILYRCVLGYSTEDVAELLEKQPNAIRALQFRALASLARLLKITDRTPVPNESGHTTAQEGGKGNATRR